MKEGKGSQTLDEKREERVEDARREKGGEGRGFVLTSLKNREETDRPGAHMSCSGELIRRRRSSFDSESRGNQLAALPIE